MADERGGREGHEPRGGLPYPWTALERSFRPSCLLTAVVLIALLLLAHLRLPPLPYSLLVIGGIWLACFIPVYLWQVGRARRR